MVRRVVGPALLLLSLMGWSCIELKTRPSQDELAVQEATRQSRFFDKGKDFSNGDLCSNPSPTPLDLKMQAWTRDYHLAINPVIRSLGKVRQSTGGRTCNRLIATLRNAGMEVAEAPDTNVETSFRHALEILEDAAAVCVARDAVLDDWDYLSGLNEVCNIHVLLEERYFCSGPPTISFIARDVIESCGALVARVRGLRQELNGPFLASPDRATCEQLVLRLRSLVELEAPAAGSPAAGSPAAGSPAAGLPLTLRADLASALGAFDCAWLAGSESGGGLRGTPEALEEVREMWDQALAGIEEICGLDRCLPVSELEP